MAYFFKLASKVSYCHFLRNFAINTSCMAELHRKLQNLRQLPTHYLVL